MLVYTIPSPKIYTIPILIFTTGILISQTGGILNTELTACKQYFQNDIKKVEFIADVGFIEETHPTMKGMQRIILKNVQFKNLQELEFIKLI